MAGFAPEVLAKLASMRQSAPMSIVGKKFYVNGGAIAAYGHGHDVAGKGQTPDTAFLTIAFALTQCVAGRHDYIFCFNTYNQDAAAAIVIPGGLNLIHIIGLELPGGVGNAQLAVTGNHAVFSLNDPFTMTLGGVEIAGFNLGGGAAHACIEMPGGACNNIWIHHCNFGHWFLTAPQDGISIGGASTCSSCLFEDNIFAGSNSPRGRLTQFGISIPAGQLFQEGIIRNNRFVRCPTCAIRVVGQATGVIIEDNKIGCGADLLGNAINLGANPNTRACLVARNEAHFGNAVMANNPYSDLTGADLNDWMSNQVGSVMKYPDEAM